MSQSGHPPRDSNLTLSHEDRIRELWDAVDELRMGKQNKFTAAAWAPMLVYIVSITLGGVWGAASLSADMSNLAETVRTATTERYHASTAQSDFALRDKDISHNSEAVSKLEKAIDRIERGVAKIHDHLTAGHNR